MANRAAARLGSGTSGDRAAARPSAPDRLDRDQNDVMGMPSRFRSVPDMSACRHPTTSSGFRSQRRSCAEPTSRRAGLGCVLALWLVAPRRWIHDTER